MPDGSLKRRVWVEVDLGKLRANYGRIASAVRPARVLCVLKANAYGLGVLPLAQALAETDTAGFGVAEPFEALQLTQAMDAGALARKGVHVLSSVLPDEIAPLVDAGVTLPVTDLPSARRIAAYARRAKRRAKVHFKIDTGMGRLGILLADAVRTVHAAVRLEGLEAEGIFSHAPMAFDPAHPFTRTQLAAFKDLVAELARGGVTFRHVHFAASDAINNFPEATRAPFNLVRAGINLHGSFDPNGRRTLNVVPVLSLKTRVAQVRRLPAGATLGYGQTYRLSRATRIATISVGYADGLPLALSNRGHVLIRGVRCPIVGRISMDYTTVDASAVPHVRAGDEVVCLGGEGDDKITPDDWAAIKGTHAYEIICAFGSRVARRPLA